MTPHIAPATEELPGHKELPCQDGRIVNDYHEHPQSALLTGCMTPHLLQLYPDEQFSIGQDNGIYFRNTKPPLDGCKAPGWFLVVGVPPLLDGEVRRSYVLWNEVIRPLIVIEYASGDGSEERDRTPLKGKFWVYEQAIVAPYYVIFDGRRDLLEVYALNRRGYHPLTADADGRFLIPELKVKLGLWEGKVSGLTATWLRVWDTTKRMLPSPDERADKAEHLVDDMKAELSEETERAERERQRAEHEEQRAEQERQRAERLAERLRQLGVDPDAA